MQYISPITQRFKYRASQMPDPRTPVEQTIASWEHSTYPTIPLCGIPTPPRRERPVRKPVPERHGVTMTFDYIPSQRVQIQPTMPLNVAGVKARDKLNIEREYVQCMVCRSSSFLCSLAELVCSHHVHPRCLQQFVTAKKSAETYPPCEICKYPAKPKDQLLNQQVRTALLRSKQLNLPATPPRSASRSLIPARTRGVQGLNIDNVAELLANESTIDSDGSSHFSDFQFKVPINVSVVPIVNTLSISAKDPCCQFLVSVSCPDYTYARPSYVTTLLDEQISTRITSGFSVALGLAPRQLGRMRLERRFEFSGDGKEWKTVRAILFEHYVVIADPVSCAPLMHAEVDTNLLSASLVACAEASVCIKLMITSSKTPVYLTSPNREHLFAFIAAITDKNLSFPLSSANPNFSLQSPFVGDFIHYLPCHTVICIPESMPVSVLAEAVGRLGPFDKIAVVQYGNKTTTFPLNRQSWHGWQELLKTDPKSPVFGSQSIASVLATAKGMFVYSQNEPSSKSIILVSEDPDNSPAGELFADIPIYTIGVGEGHSAALLTRVSAVSRGHYVYSSKANVSKYITNMVCEDQTLTHENVRITLKSRQGVLSGISGYGNGPGENSALVGENRAGNFVINLGRLHAGHRQSFVASVDIDEKMLKYTCEDSELDILEVIAEADMATSLGKVCERKSGRVRMDINNVPVLYFRGLHADFPLNSNYRLDTLRDVIALATTQSLERLVKVIQTDENTIAVSIIKKMIQNLESTSRYLSDNFKCNTKTEANLVLNCTLLMDVLLSSLRHLQGNINQRSTIASILHMNWILRSSRSFLHNTSLEAIYFDTNKRNVI